MRRSVFTYAVVLLLLCGSAHSNRGIPPPWFQDPDEFIDSVGKRTVDEEEPADWFLSREDLNSGKVTASIGSGNDAARAGIIQDDGKIVLGGRTNTNTLSDFGIIRFYPDGSIDTTYGSVGRVKTTFGSNDTSDELIHAMALQTDGKVVAAGKVYTSTGSYLFALARYNSNGTLDTSFNQTGKVTTSILGSADIARALVVDTSARLLVGGYGWNGTKFDSIVVRYLPDGSLDTSYFSTGKRVLAFSANDNSILSLQLNTAGQVVAGGASYNGTDFDAAITRFLTDGRLDTTFNSTGKATSLLSGGHDFGYAVTLRDAAGASISNGSAVIDLVGGVTSGGLSSISITQFFTDGSLDTSFNSVGKKIISNIPNYNESVGLGARVELGAGNVSLLVAGKALLSGAANDWDFVLAKVYVANNDAPASVGQLDTSFSSDGFAISSFGNAEDASQALIMKGEDVIYAAGRAKNGTKFNFGLARFNTDGTEAPSGTLDKGFGNAGTINGISGISSVSDMAVSPDDTMYVAGTKPVSGSSAPPFMAKYNSRGNLMVQTTLALSGSATGIAVQSDLKAVLAGYISTTEFLIARFTPSGALDTAFSSDGYNVVSGYSGSPYGVIVDTSDRALFAGTRSDNFLTLFRFETNGELDTSFFTKGHTTQNTLPQVYTRRLVFDPSNGRIAVSADKPDTSSITITRFETNGVLDTSFGSGGMATQSYAGKSSYAKDISLDSQGRYWVLGSASDLVIGSQPLIVRYTPNGFLDTSFHSDGFSVSFSGISEAGTLAENDKGYLAGADKIMRYMSDGVLDTSFASSGIMTYGSANHARKALKLRKGGQVCSGSHDQSDLSIGIACAWQ